MTDRLPVVILAGGISRRFSGDKLRARLDGSTVLERVVDRAAPLASPLMIATSSPARGDVLAQNLMTSPRFLYDQPSRWGEGPAGAIAQARALITRGPLLILPGDIPWVETAALTRFTTEASRSGADVAVPFWRGGETEHLIQWQRAPSVLSFLPSQLRTFHSDSWRASEFLRAVPRTLLVPVNTLTENAASFSHVTVPGDLAGSHSRGELGSSGRFRELEGRPKRAYRTAHQACRSGQYPQAARAFNREARWYTRAGLPLLANHARNDARRCLDVISGKDRHTPHGEFPLRGKRVGADGVPRGPLLEE